MFGELLNKNKLLIIGGTGNLGKSLKKNIFFKGSYFPRKNKLNLLKKSQIKKFISEKKIKLIINTAAIARMRDCENNKSLAYKTNVIGCRNIVNSIKEINKNIKLIHISTDEVYGDVLKGRSDENYSYNPSSPYAASKASSDHLVSSYIKTYKIPAIITNCSNNFGPKQHPEKLIPKLIYNILNNISLPIYGKGTNSREWIFVQDHCNALLKISKIGKIGNFYNIGSNKNIENIKVCKNLINIAKSKIKIGKNVKIKFVKDRPGHDIRYALNSKKIIRELKWHPKTTFRNGLIKTFNWYLNNSNYYSSFKKKDILKRLGLN